MTDIIALHFPERLERMYMTQKEGFVIQIKGEGLQNLQAARASHHKFNFSAMKLFDRFRKIVMRVIFSVPSAERSHQATPRHVPRRRSCDRPDTPKTSCSYYHSSNSHYNEAIADCIEFFNKSSQEGMMNSRRSDAMV